MGHKGRVQRTGESEGQEMVHLWTFESREKLDKFAAVLESNGVVYEIQTRKEEAASGTAGVVIAVRQLDTDKAKKLLMKHRKRRTSSDFT